MFQCVRWLVRYVRSDLFGAKWSSVQMDHCQCSGHTQQDLRYLLRHLLSLSSYLSLHQTRNQYSDLLKMLWLCSSTLTYLLLSHLLLLFGRIQFMVFFSCILIVLIVHQQIRTARAQPWTKDSTELESYLSSLAIGNLILMAAADEASTGFSSEAGWCTVVGWGTPGSRIWASQEKPERWGNFMKFRPCLRIITC